MQIISVKYFSASFDSANFCSTPLSVQPAKVAFAELGIYQFRAKILHNFPLNTRAHNRHEDLSFVWHQPVPYSQMNAEIQRQLFRF